MKMKKGSWCFLFLLPFSALSALASPDSGKRPIAYVYDDVGACEEGCVEAAVAVARRNRLKVIRVKKADLPQFGGDLEPRVGDVWIQPGGNAIEVAQHLGPRGLSLLRRWIANGMNYVGICAGAFLADRTVNDENTEAGLGLLRFSTQDFLPGRHESVVLRQYWRGMERWIYFQDGATFDIASSKGIAPSENDVEVISNYEDGRPSVIQTGFGYGKVILSGVHPEAPPAWLRAEGLSDADGSDDDLADELIQRALEP